MSPRPLGAGARLLVIRPGALGDTLVSLPAIRCLRRAVGAKGGIELVGYPSALQLALNPLHADQIHSIDRALFAGLFSETRVEDIAGFLQRFDGVIAWCRDEDGHLSRLLERLDVFYVLSPPFPPRGSRTHAADHLLRTLAPLGVAEPAAVPEVVLPESAVSAGRQRLDQLSVEEERFVAVHPGSGSPEKNWSPRGFAELIRGVREAGLKVLLVEGPADAGPVERIVQCLETRPARLLRPDVLVAAWVLSRAAAYVGNDSGVTHLAAAMGTPTWALFGPTDPAVWAPRGPKVHIASFQTPPGELCKAICSAWSGRKKL